MSKRFRSKRKTDPKGVAIIGDKDSFAPRKVNPKGQTCMYCKKKFKYGGKEKNYKCCYECRKVRDWCKIPECNNHSGHPIIVGGKLIPGMCGYGPPVSFYVNDYLDNPENRKQLLEDDHHMENHCIDCFYELIQFGDFDPDPEDYIPDFEGEEEK